MMMMTVVMMMMVSMINMLMLIVLSYNPTNLLYVGGDLANAEEHGISATVEEDIRSLRDQGFGDKAILEINQITGFFAWCNRTVDGLGVELEDFWDDPDATNV